MLAYTESGELYSWGHNGYCQLGNGSTNQGLTPAIIQNSLLGRKVVQVRAVLARPVVDYVLWRLLVGATTHSA